MKASIERFFNLFDDNLSRDYIVGLSVFFHAGLIITIGMLKKDSPLSTFLAMAAAFSIMPITLLARNLREFFTYVAIAISPIPGVIALLLLLVFVVGTVKGVPFKFDTYLMILKTPLLIFIVYAAIYIPFVIVALILRFALKLWIRR